MAAFGRLAARMAEPRRTKQRVEADRSVVEHRLQEDMVVEMKTVVVVERMTDRSAVELEVVDNRVVTELVEAAELADAVTEVDVAMVVAVVAVDDSIDIVVAAAAALETVVVVAAVAVVVADIAVVVLGAVAALGVVVAVGSVEVEDAID